MASTARCRAAHSLRTDGATCQPGRKDADLRTDSVPTMRRWSRPIRSGPSPILSREFIRPHASFEITSLALDLGRARRIHQSTSHSPRHCCFPKIRLPPGTYAYRRQLFLTPPSPPRASLCSCVGVRLQSVLRTLFGNARFPHERQSRQPFP